MTEENEQPTPESEGAPEDTSAPTPEPEGASDDASPDSAASVLPPADEAETSPVSETESSRGDASPDARSEEPVAEETAADEEPVAEEPVAEDEPVAEEPVAEEPVAEDEPAVEKPAADESSAAEEPGAAEEPAVAAADEPTRVPEPQPAQAGGEQVGSAAGATGQAEGSSAGATGQAEDSAAGATGQAEGTAAEPTGGASAGATGESQEEVYEELTPRQRPEIPGADLEPDLMPDGDEYLDAEAQAAAEAEAEEARARAEAEEQEAQPIADAAIDLAAGARYTATGKRKTAVARVILKPGSGSYSINGKELATAFPRETLQRMIRQPLETVGYESRMDVVARMHGGGISAQAGALRHGISRALIEADPNLRGELKRRGFLTRDPRVKERKKAGLKKARKRPQFSKR